MPPQIIKIIVILGIRMAITPFKLYRMLFVVGADQLFGAQIGGLIFAPLGPLGVCVGVAAFGIVGDYLGENYLSPFVLDKVYGK